MAFIQSVTPPPNKMLNFSLKDFSGGMNNRSDQLEDNEGAIVKNLMFADDVILETRYGQKYYSETVYDGEVIFIDMYRPYKDEDQLVVATPTTLYIGDKTIPLKGKPTGKTHLGKYYFTDGEVLKVYANFNYDYDGKDPISSEEYSDKVVDKEKYSGLTIIPASELAVKDAEANKKKVYVDFAKKLINQIIDNETKKNELLGKVNAIVVEEDKVGLQSTYLREVGTKPTGYNFYDVVSPNDGHAKLGKEYVRGVMVIDYTKKELSYEPCEHEFEDHLKGACKVPEKAKYIVSHDGRLFVSGHDKDDDNVFITDLQNPLYYAVGLPIQLPPTSDKITGMHVFDDSVVVGRESDMYVILGSTNNPNIGVDVFSLKKLNTHTGLASHNAVNIAHNYLIFLGSDGMVYALQSARMNERNLATQVISKTIDLTAEPINLTRSDYPNAVSFFYNDEWYLSMDNKTMVYSYRHMAWVMYEGLKARSCFGIDGEWIWGRPEGKIAMFDKEQFFDFGQPYQSTWYSKIFDMDDANSFKQFREFFLVTHTFEEHFSDIYVTFEVDYANVKDRAIISNQVARWGKAVWGDRFVNKNINGSIPFVIGQRGRNIRFIITNGYDLDGTVNSYEDLENYPKKREGLLVRLSTGENYLYTNRKWELFEELALNQRMKVYQINGDFEMRGKR